MNKFKTNWLSWLVVCQKVIVADHDRDDTPEVRSYNHDNHLSPAGREVTGEEDSYVALSIADLA